MRELEGVITDIIFRNDANGYTVFSLEQGQDEWACVGVLPQIAPGLHVRVQGETAWHPSYGEQFKVEVMEQTMPTERGALEKYLSSGLIVGIGRSTAKKLLDFFGDNILDALSDWRQIAQVKGIGSKRAREMADSFKEQSDMREAMIFLQKFDISPALAMKIYKFYGEHTSDVLRNNPYRLIYDIQKVGFKTADAIARAMGYEPLAAPRLEAALVFMMHESAFRDGHSYLPRELLLGKARDLLDAPEDMLINALATLLLRRELLSSELKESEAVYLPRFLAAENEVARRLIALCGEIDDIPEDLEGKIAGFEKNHDIEFHEGQREAILAAARNRLLVITGGPGTGKTTIIRCILDIIADKGKTLLAAPTGRAAKRMSLATDREAKTIHRLLEYEPSQDREAFTRDENNPLDADTLIVDEMSMVDITLMHSLLRALKPGSRLILVGDANQLPSVGAGNVLRDILESERIPAKALTEIFRQALKSMIVVNAYRVHNGEMPMCNASDSDFFLVRSSRENMADSVVGLVLSRLPSFTGYPTMELQVISPMRKGDAGVNALNSRLQAALNPPGPPEIMLHGRLFRKGDKVMQIRNNYQMMWLFEGEEGNGVFNGDMGIIIHIDHEDSQITVRFDDDRVATYTEAQTEELELAYCISVHKSQGSEFPVVVMPVIYGPPLLYTRNLLYTAVTRAREYVVLVGDEGAVQRMVQNNYIDQRFSALAERLKS